MTSLLRSCYDWTLQHSRHVNDVVQRSRRIWLQERAFERFLKTVPPRPLVEASRPAVTIVRPWWGTGEPWHMTTLALLIERLYGNAVVLFDDTILLRLDLAHPVENLAVKRALGRVPLRWYRLSDFSGDSPLGDDEIDKVARYDAIKAYRSDGWSTPRQQAHPDRVRVRLRRTAGRYARFMQEVRPRFVAVSTGFQTTAGLVPRIGAKLGIRVATTDGDEGTRLMNVDGIAAHQSDIPRLLEMLSPLDPWAIQMAKEHWEARTRGVDRASLQSVPLGAPDTSTSTGVLIPLNQSYDTAALDRSRFFTEQGDWLVQTVAWLLQNSDERITIRQHPVERHWPGNDRYAARLMERFGASPRITVYDCHAKVNTYDLIRRARVVLPHTSTVGLESIAMGIPVVVEAHTPYATLLPQPATKQEYFAMIKQALAGESMVSAAQRGRAWEVYFLTQICSYLPTHFTGWIGDFWKWVPESFEALARRPDVALIVEALQRNIPLPALRYQQMRRSQELVARARPE